MKNIIICFILLLIFDHPQIYSQNIDTISNFLKIEEILGNQTETNQYLKDELQAIFEKPIDLNHCSDQDIYKIPFITPKAAYQIIRYKTATGSIENISTVRDLIGQVSYESIMPFIKIFEKDFTKIKFTTSVLNTLEKSRGYDSVFKGNPIRMMNKIQLFIPQYKISSGMIIEKDAGEQNIADHFAGYLNYKSENIDIILGDYLIGFGRGLCISKPSNYSKSSETILTTKKSDDGSSVFAYNEENLFFRGLSLDGIYNNFRISSFYSYKKSDANIDGMGFISSQYLNGLHRYDSEIKKSDVLNQTIYGSRIGYQDENKKVNFNFCKIKYSNNLDYSGYYGLKGNNFSTASIDFDIFSNKINLFGEFSITEKHSNALLIGSIFEPNEKFLFSILYRNYQKDFANPIANAFCESITQNEKGIYFGISVLPFEHIKISGYYDFFKFPYRTYFNPLPTSGKDGLVSIEMNFFQRHKLWLKYKNELKEEIANTNDSFGREIEIISGKIKESLRIEIQSEINKNLKIKGRFEKIFIKNKETNASGSGTIIFGDLTLRLIEFLLIQSRLCYFDTFSYNSSIYTYESDIEGVYNSIELAEKGTRFYFYLSYELNKIISLRGKYSNTDYNNLNMIGSGYDRINANSINKISFQIQVRI